MHWLRTLAAVILIGTLASGCNSRGAMNATLPVPEQSPRSAALTIPAPHSTKLDIAPRPHSRAATRHAATAIKPLSLAESVVLPSPTQISLSVSHDAASVPAFNLHVLQPESTQLPMSSGIPLSYRQSIDLGVWPAGGTRLVAVAGGRTVVDTGVVDFAPLAGSAITVVAVDNEWTSEGAGSPIELRVHLPHFDSESPHNPSPLNSRSIEPRKTGLEAVAKEHVRQVMHRSPVPRPEGSTCRRLQPPGRHGPRARAEQPLRFDRPRSVAARPRRIGTLPTTARRRRRHHTGADVDRPRHGGRELAESDSLRTHVYTVRKALDKPYESALLQSAAGAGYRIIDET